MSDIIPFAPSADRLCERNMADFLLFCREQLEAFGKELDFESHDWDVTEFYYIRGSSYRFHLRFRYQLTNLGVPAKTTKSSPPMPEPFASQVKSYVRYQNAFTAAAHPPQPTMLAFRLLLIAFSEMNVRPNLVLLDSHVLNHAVAIARHNLSNDAAAAYGTVLGRIAHFLRVKMLANMVPAGWRHGLSFENPSNRRVHGRPDLYPSADMLLAIPEAFRRATLPIDVVVTSVIALLTCAPSRINEVFGLPRDCELTPIAEGETAYMLQWAGSKGYQNHWKGIPGVMADVARESITRIRSCTYEAQIIAEWYEDNPTMLYLPPDCTELRGKDLTCDDIAKITGIERGWPVNDWLRRQRIKPIDGVYKPGRGRGYLFPFKELEEIILKLLPRGFPVADPLTGLKFSEALLVVQRGFFNNIGSFRWRCMIELASYGDIVPRDDRVTVFVRLGVTNPDDPVVFRSHMLRRYLNTLAQQGGLSEAEIAAWSGRSDVRQNATYDYRGEAELISQKRTRDRNAVRLPALADVINRPVSRSDVSLKVNHGHATEIGFCEHDFSASPCAMFMECLHCTKHVCVKGREPGHVMRIEAALGFARSSLNEAIKARDSEFYGAEEWIVSHTETVERLEQLLEILGDPLVPDGSVVRLSKSGRYTLFEQAMEDVLSGQKKLAQQPNVSMITYRG